MKKENMKPGRNIDSKRNTRVLLEDIQSNVKIIAEGHTGIISRLDRVETRLGAVESELHTVKMVVFDLDSRLTKVDHKLDISIEQNDGRFRQIEKKLALA